MRFYLDIPVQLPGNIQKTYDLIVPEGVAGGIPLLVWIHGGGWCGGEKRIYNDFERFSHRGYAVLSIDYRFSQDAPFPAQLIDCKTAIRWARANAVKYGYNAEKILVGGSSAGGHLAALLGVTNGQEKYDRGPYLEYSSDVQAVVDEFGPSDLMVEKLPALKKDLQALLQNDAEKIHHASPSRLVCGGEPPFLILHGTADSCVPIEQSRELANILKQAGNAVQFIEIPSGGHGFDTREFYDTLAQFVLSQLPKL